MGYAENKCLSVVGSSSTFQCPLLGVPLYSGTSYKGPSL